MALLLLCVALNLAVSVAVLRCPLYETGQKWCQIVLIWLLPMIGPALIGGFLHSQFDSPRFDPSAGHENEGGDLPPLGHSADGAEHSPP
ncbi:hypothetical protein [Jeongeupia chitinilytica]|nr:hypothetical protein [Jeongeupia chitinilytica]